MRRSTMVLALGALVVGACDQPEPTAVLPVFSTPAMAMAANGKNAAVPLSGDNEVPARETEATGVAIFHLSKDGQSIEYKLIVDDIQNVVASHIHLEAAGNNGPVVLFLYGPAPAGGGPIEGVIAEGVKDASNLIGPLAGQPLSALIDAMRSGGAYVNVHTNDGVGSINTGPGDFPGGEIRGQVR